MGAGGRAETLPPAEREVEAEAGSCCRTVARWDLMRTGVKPVYSVRTGDKVVLYSAVAFQIKKTKSGNL